MKTKLCIKFGINGDVNFRGEHFNIGEATVLFCLADGGVVFFSSPNNCPEEKSFWIDTLESTPGNPVNFRDFIRDMYVLFMSKKESLINMSKKVIENIKMNQYWYSDKKVNVLFLWHKPNTIRDLTSMTDVEGENIREITY